MPSSTSATGKSTSFMRRNTASSRPSRLTVTRLQAGVLQGAGLARQQRAVGGQREVQRLAVRRAQRGELLDQHLDVLAQQRLAAGEADLAHAVRHEQPRQPRDLLEAQQRAVRQVLVVLVEHFLGHAVAAAEVAAVGHADAQVAQRPAQRVGEQAGGRRWPARARARGQRGDALVDQGKVNSRVVGPILPARPCRGLRRSGAPSTSMQTPEMKAASSLAR